MPVTADPRTEATSLPAGAEAVARYEARLARLDGPGRVAYALGHLPGRHVLSSSFGIQSAVLLHLVTREQPDIPVIFIDTGYLFPETYRFVDLLVERLRLNLVTYRSTVGPAWQEARHGQRWLQGLPGLESYNRDNKVEPLERALAELGAGCWFAGLRRSQSASRARAPFITRRGQAWKLHPIADWTDRDVHRYLAAHRLPYHPLREHGYLSVGDVHTTRPLHAVSHPDETRFFGLKRECGLHDGDLGAEPPAS